MRRQIFKISIGQILLIIIIVAIASWIFSLFKDNDIPVPKNEENVVLTNTLNQTVKPIEEESLNKTLKNNQIVYVTSVKDNGENYTISGIIYEKYVLTEAELRYILDDGEMIIGDEVYIVYEENEGYGLYMENSDILIYMIKLVDDEYILEAQTELSDCYRLTDEIYKIIVEKDAKVEEAYGDSFTAEEVFGNMENSIPIETTHPDTKRTYRFKFFNGKCNKIEDVLTSI